MPRQPNGAYHAARQAELDQRLEQYVRGDSHALDGFDEVQRAYESSIDPNDFNTEDGFMHVCVDDLMANGELNRGEALAACHTRWAEHSNNTTGPKLPPALNDGQKQVLREHQRQRPTFDPITQKLWDSWFARSFDVHMARHVQAVSMGFNAVTQEIVRIIKSHNELDKDMDAALDVVVLAQQKNTEAIYAIRENTRKEMVDLIKRQDRCFTAEVNGLRDHMIFRNGEDMNIMYADVKKILHLKFTDGITKAREELREEHDKKISDLIKTKENLESELTTLREKISCLGDDLNVTTTNAANIMRDELADEFIKTTDVMREELHKQLRAEMRQEFAKILRTSRKHRKA